MSDLLLAIHLKFRKYVPFYGKVYTKNRERLLDFLTHGQTRKILKLSSSLPDVFANHYANSKIDEEAIVYESFHGDRFNCSPRAIFNTIYNNKNFKNYKHYIILKSEVINNISIEKNDNVKLVKINTAEYAKILATSKYLINNSTFPYWFVRRDGQRYANVWHGTAIKQMFKHEGGQFGGYANSQRNFLQASDILLPCKAGGEYILSSCDIELLCAHKASYIGSPRLDQAIREKQAQGRLGDRKQVLYAPTWRGSINEFSINLEEIKETIATIKNALPNAEIIFSPHNFLLSRFDVSELEVKIVTVDQCISDLLGSTDLLISDYSSIIIDALAVGIPVIMYAPDFDEYKRSRGFEINPETIPALLVDGKLELEAALTAPDLFTCKPKIEPSFNSSFLAQEDGLACERFITAFFKSKAPKQTKKRGAKQVIFYGGGMLRNGITTSFLNLLSNLKDKNLDIYVISDGKNVKNVLETLWPVIGEDVKVLHRVGKEGFTREEQIAKNQFYRENILPTGRIGGYFKNTMQREWRRLFGDTLFDAVIDFSGYRRYWSAIITGASAKRKIIGQHNDLYQEANERFPILYGIFSLYPLYDIVFAVSDGVRDVNRKRLSFFYKNSKQHVTIRNSLDIEKIRRVKQHEYKFSKLDNKKFFDISESNTTNSALKLIPAPSEDTIDFINIGRFSPEKNQLRLLHMFAQVIKQEPKARLYLCGDGPLRSEIESLINVLELKQHVILVGYTSKALELLNICDCFLLPSLYEGQPMVILEALSLETHIIASDIPASRSLLDGYEDQLISYEDEDRWISEILKFCELTNQNKPPHKIEFDPVRYNDEVTKEFTKYL